MNEYDDEHLRINPNQLHVYVEGKEQPVTLTQWRILLALLSTHPNAVTNQEIEAVLFGSDTYRWNYNAISNYVFRLKRMIGREYIEHNKAGYLFVKRDGSR